MLGKIFKEAPYLFPFLTQKNFTNKQGNITFSKEILFNSFDNLFNSQLENNRHIIFNKDIIFKGIEDSNLDMLGNLEYLTYLLLGDYNEDKYFFHKNIIDDIYFVHNDSIIDKKNVELVINNNMYSILDKNYKPFYTFTLNNRVFVFLQSGMTTNQQTLIYHFLREKKYKKTSLISYNFSNLWSQKLFDYVILNISHNENYLENISENDNFSYESDFFSYNNNIPPL